MQEDYFIFFSYSRECLSDALILLSSRIQNISEYACLCVDVVLYMDKRGIIGYSVHSLRSLQPSQAFETLH